jgi:crotonobetainyl-CoA:carnitine CoA-transferase CaiB-like acyl-CoA transferase
MHGALKNCTVLDLSRLFPGPYCSMILADHGARVIAIEDRRFEQDAVPALSNVNRNKEHITLNLKSEKGKEIFFSLAKKADVIMEGFRPGVTERLGIGYDDVKKINPKIVYCSITGYGQNGPLRDQVGHDVNFLGYSGVLSVIGPRNGAPCIPGIQIADMVGGMNAAIGILLALYARHFTGTGQYIDISMTDAVTAMLPFPAGTFWTSGIRPEKGNLLLSHRYACYNIYETADGKYLTLGALEPRFWKNICEYFQVPEYMPLQFDETGKKEEITAFFQKAFLKKSRDEWMEIFKDKDVCLGGVMEVDEALSGETAKSRDMIVSLEPPGKETAFVLGTPVKLTETPGSVRTPPPKFGENTHAVLEELGFSDAEISQMAAEGVI